MTPRIILFCLGESAERLLRPADLSALTATPESLNLEFKQSVDVYRFFFCNLELH